MNVVIPPLLFYAVGAVLVVVGTLRSLLLGRRRPGREIADDDPARERFRRRHFVWGIIWVALGLFLIVSTAGVLKSNAPSPGTAPAVNRPEAPGAAPAPAPPRPEAAPAPSSPPALRVEPGSATTATPPAGR